MKILEKVIGQLKEYDSPAMSTYQKRPVGPFDYMVSTNLYFTGTDEVVQKRIEAMVPEIEEKIPYPVSRVNINKNKWKGKEFWSLRFVVSGVPDVDKREFKAFIKDELQRLGAPTHSYGRPKVSLI